ncbi:aldehyde reductase [Sporolactobacillus sp. CPB3-1]|uniref:Aldehyde reductase n=1 Tax=Sporolactobacillus mangiferae TaxID=2940498 RepID=A0ABT0MEE1_9BACL|nr:aldehyde reductase [Sporolactobacillus mangiferae]MCL1632968.1 aldehyde reductase [Sporolactobacillus mangiferae]
MTQSNNKTVLVTGGTGFVAGWAIHELLKQGYVVRTTVRSEEKKENLQNDFLHRGMDTHALTVYVADLTSDEGWKEVVTGANYVLHIASPLSAENQDDLDSFVGPARDGAIRVIREAVKAGVERVVMTSSLAAATPEISNKDQHINESLWTNPNDKNLNAYRKSKAIAEKAAWDFMKEQNSKTTLTTILPGAIFGPVLFPTIPGSIEVIQRLIQGKGMGNPKIRFEIVDVRDLVDLHIRAMIHPQAAGQRYIATGGFMWMNDVAKFLKEKLGEKGKNIPTKTIPDFVLRSAAKITPSLGSLVPMLGRKFRYTSAKAKTQLNWNPRPVEETILDSARKLEAFKLI